jgi:hypothetical protein
MLADSHDDLAAAIDEDGGAGPLEPWTDGDLDNRDGKERNEKDDHRTHVIPPQPELPAEVIISGHCKIRIKRTLQKCIVTENPP